MSNRALAPALVIGVATVLVWHAASVVTSGPDERSPSEATWHITGRVVDASGNPVAGATILVWSCERTLDSYEDPDANRPYTALENPWRPASLRRKQLGTLSCDHRGRFDIHAVPSYARLDVEARVNAPFVSTTATVDFDLTPPHEIVIRRSRGVLFRGRITDALGHGVTARVDLSMSPADANRGTSDWFHKYGVTSKADGRFSVDAVPAGKLHVVVTVTDRIRVHYVVNVPDVSGPAESSIQSADRSQRQAPETELRVGWSDNARIVGVVQDRSGKAVPNATLEAHLEVNSDKVNVVVLGKTKTDGTFAISGLPPSELRLVVAKAHEFERKLYYGGRRTLVPKKTLDIEPIVLGERRDAMDFESFLSANGYNQDRIDVSGTVVDTRGKPVQGAAVHLTESWRAIREWRPTGHSARGSIVVSNTQGEFTFRETHAGARCRIVAQHNNQRSEVIAAENVSSKSVSSTQSNEALQNQLTIGETFNVRGIVVDPKGRRVTRVSLFDFERRKMCDVEEDGTFLITGRPAGVQRLYVGRNVGTPISGVYDLKIEAGLEQRPIVLTTIRRWFTSGRVVNEDGSRASYVEGTSFHLAGHESSRSLGAPHFRTDIDGRFTMSHWSIRDRIMILHGCEQGERFTPGTRGMLIQRKLRKTSKRVTIRVVDAEGVPIPRCKLMVNGGPNGNLAEDYVVDGGLIHAEIPFIDTEWYGLHITSAQDAIGRRLNLMRADVTIRPDRSKDVTFRLTTGSVIRGTVVSTTGEPIQGIRVRTLDLEPTFSDAEGRFEIPGAAAKRTRLIVRASPRWHHPAKTYVNADMKDVQIVLEPNR